MVAWLRIHDSWKKALLRAGLATAPILAVTLYLYVESKKAEAQLLEDETVQEADTAFLQFQNLIATQIQALRSVADFVSCNPASPATNAFETFAGRVIARVPNFERINQLDADGQPMLTVPPAAAALERPHEDAGFVAAMGRAGASQRPAGTGSFGPDPGDQAITMIVPLSREGAPDGYIAGTIRVTQGIKGLFGPEVTDYWHVEFFDRAGRSVYRSEENRSSQPPSSSLVAERFIPVADVGWKMRMWATPLRARSVATSAPRRILGIGLLATLVTAVANYLLAQRQQRLGETLRESKRLAAAVEATRRHLSDLVNGIEAVIWESDAGMFRFTFVNDYARKLLGIETDRWVAEPAFWYEHVHPGDRERARENARAARQPGHTYPIEYRMLDAAGRVLWVREIITVISEAGRVLGRRGVVVDITPRVQAEEAVRQSQKLESLGVLAGGIAHDFNNLLTTILGNTEMLLPLLAKCAPEGAVHLDKIERTTRRLAELTRQMLAYSGRSRFAVSEVSLNTLILEMSELLGVSTPKNVAVTYELDPDPPLLEADAVQIGQVILNLLTNANEAIGDNRDGKVVIRTDTCTLGASEAADLFPGQDLAPGQYVRLEVSDNGEGMEPETLSRIFDPFFTTKFTGRGLGLAALQGIVRGHRGAIRIFSQPGQGTVFTVLFPAGRKGLQIAPKELPVRTPETGVAGLGVLFVDDEEGLRSLMAQALEEAGCTVFQAVDGQDGVEQFERHADQIDVVVLDLTMPRLSGDEVFNQILAMRPNTCVILCSGYTEEDVVRQFAGLGLAGFIEKPFRPSDLIDKIATVLASRHSRSRLPEPSQPRGVYPHGVGAPINEPDPQISI